MRPRVIVSAIDFERRGSQAEQLVFTRVWCGEGLPPIKSIKDGDAALWAGEIVFAP